MKKFLKDYKPQFICGFFIVLISIIKILKSLFFKGFNNEVHIGNTR